MSWAIYSAGVRDLGALLRAGMGIKGKGVSAHTVEVVDEDILRIVYNVRYARRSNDQPGDDSRSQAIVLVFESAILSSGRSIYTSMSALTHNDPSENIMQHICTHSTTCLLKKTQPELQQLNRAIASKQRL